MRRISTMLYFLVFLLILGIFAACTSIKNSKPVQVKAGFDWQGHRGCRGLMPENSVPAFVKALDYKEVQTLELDVAVSKDAKLIVSHEPWFNPGICTHENGDSLKGNEENPDYWLYNLTAEEISKFDCGSKGNSRFPQQDKQRSYKPTLREVVNTVAAASPNRQMHYNIEIKSTPDWDGKKTPSVNDFVDLVLKELEQLGIADRSTVQSFDVRPLQEIKRLAPKQTLALLVENPLGYGSNVKRLGFTPDIYSPYYFFVSKGLVDSCHQNGVKVIPWTVNDVKTMRSLIRKGVDGIITDYPDLIEAVSAKKK